MIERLRLALDANHLPLMKQDDEGSYVKYEDAKAALLGALNNMHPSGTMYSYLRPILGDELIDEWIGEQNEATASKMAAGQEE